METISANNGGGQNCIDLPKWVYTCNDARCQKQTDSGAAPSLLSAVKKAIKRVTGEYRGRSNMCAMSVRAYLRAAGHPQAASIRTRTGNLDPDGTAYSGPTFAASFAGTDLGQHIMDRSRLKPGDILLYRDTEPGKWTPGAVTHVGVYTGNGMQADHNRAKGFHERSLAGVLNWAKWGGGIRLKGFTPS